MPLLLPRPAVLAQLRGAQRSDIATTAAHDPVHPVNPLDITGNVLQDTPMIGQAMQCLAADKDTHAIVLIIGMMHSIADAFVQALSQARKEVHCPIVVIWVGALESSIQALEAAGIPVFLDIPQATTAMSRCLWATTAQKAIATRPQAPAPGAHRDAGGTAATLSEWDGKQLLSSQKAVAIPKGWLLQEGAPLPADLPFPLVAKLQSPELLHKSDAEAWSCAYRTRKRCTLPRNDCSSWAVN